MAKIISKYFIAWVPSEKLCDQVHQLKLNLKDTFGLKYALKSPPHITLKMPFNWNEAKEDILLEKLKGYAKNLKAFSIQFDGFGRFGKRVIFVKVNENKDLIALQSNLTTFCKKELKLVSELSDRNYHPHMTIAFKDIKENEFDLYWKVISTSPIQAKEDFGSISLLKRKEGKWGVINRIDFMF
ncbi:2'-5' RNA ligase [Belliella buryatensis]|uniref:2'-5' RNA ligase n=1 Tax=Belliella buryatensis TaxID=1500549 RepID=A0A239DGL3_9BACT|nr:2'-5' RNA ligase family protein [Belliella buryatensis]SNS31417.1 2'-5' RNA ligase [Belliella buryatensis]